MCFSCIFTGQPPSLEMEEDEEPSTLQSTAELKIVSAVTSSGESHSNVRCEVKSSTFAGTRMWSD